MENKEGRLLYDHSQEIDWLKLRMILHKSWLFSVLILILTNVSSYLYIRWTKPLFVSESQIKLNIKNEAGILGLEGMQDEQSLNNISGEIELLRSRMFSEKVIKTLNLQVSYFSVGNILNDERYFFSPFSVEAIQATPYAEDIPVYLTIQDDHHFDLDLGDENTRIRNLPFGEMISFRGMKFKIKLKDKIPKDQKNFFFVINSEASLVSYLENNLSVEPININAKTIRISFKDHNPYKARDLVNAIDTLYLNYTREEKLRTNNQKIIFLDRQLNATEEKINSIESYFESSARQYHSLNPEQEGIDYLEKINLIEEENVELKNKRNKINKLSTLIVNEDSIYIPAFLEENTRLTEDLNKMKEELANTNYLLQTYNSTTGKVKLQLERTAELKENLLKEIGAFTKDLDDKMKMNGNVLTDLRKKFAGIPERSNELNKKKRYYSLYEDFYLSLMQSKTEFQIAQAGITTDFKILSQASMPANPVSPQKTLIFGLGIISGFLLSFFFVGIRYVMHDKISSVEEIERKTHLPVLGSLPFYSTEKLKTSRLLVNNHPRAAISESLRTIRTNLEFFLPGKKSTILSVTSTVSGEGKTFFCVNLGGIISMSSKKVVIVDLDMRKPRVHKAFDHDNPNGGVSTILIGKEDVDNCIMGSSMENLFFLPAGPPPPNPSELLLKSDFDLLIENLKSRFDVVILDTPPAGLVTDGLLAMKKADLPIYVLRADFSRSRYLDMLMRLCKLHKFGNLTVLLNSIKIHRQGYGYGDGYYSN